MRNYDLIAPVYARDMGASMPFDDAGYYIQVAHQNGGPVLELGCGSGRILGRLIDAGIDASGIDQSLPMLRLARKRCGPTAALLQMDMRAMALRRHFSLALLPYSLATYLLSESDWQRCADGIRATLLPTGQVMLDAFIPRPQSDSNGWQRDYARPGETGWLVRHKRIRPQADGSNIIERRYRLRGTFEGRTLLTRERIQPLSPERLRAVGERYFGRLQRLDYDYQPGSQRKADSRFCSALFAID